jgi:hypothetical protein
VAELNNVVQVYVGSWPVDRFVCDRLNQAVSQVCEHHSRGDNGVGYQGLTAFDAGGRLPVGTKIGVIGPHSYS